MQHIGKFKEINELISQLKGGKKKDKARKVCQGCMKGVRLN
jgi:hypothetical protein